MIKSHIFKILTLSIGILLLSCQQNPDLPSEVIESIEKRVEYGINPSIAIGIVDNKGTRFYNFGKVKKEGKEVDEHTIYEIGSITKTFTGILLAKQVIDGKVKLDDPINNYLPSDIKVPVIWSSDEITFGNLSDHTSGLPRLPGNFKPANWNNPYVDYSIEQLYEFISSYKPVQKVGYVYEYSNLAQGLLGHILALNAEISYDSLLKRDIGSALDMQETKITFDEKMENNLAIGHYSVGFETDSWDLITLAGAGGIRSSSFDMTKYLSANLGLIETPLYNAMQLSHKPRHHKASSQSVGLGWHISKGDEDNVIMHSGGTGGYRAFVGFVKEKSKGVVVLSNSTANIEDIGLHLLDNDFKLKTVKPSLAIKIRQVIDKEGIESGEAFFNKIQQWELENYTYDANDMNELGLSYINQNLDIALKVFELHMLLFPKSFIGYDGSGYVLRKKGQKALATEYYQKSLALNPTNPEAIQALAELESKLDLTR